MTLGSLAPRSDFPVTSRVAYLNAAGIGLVPAPVIGLHESLSREIGETGTLAFFKHAHQIQNAAQLAGTRLLGAERDSVVIVKGVSEALNQIAWWLRPKAGQNVVSIDIESPAATFPWLRIAEETGAEVRFVTVRDDPASLSIDRIASLVDRSTVAICISHVQWVTGHCLDLAQLAELAHRNGALLIVDAYQSAGVVPIDVKASGVDVLVAGAMKWLSGYAGAGVCYVRPELLANMRPVLTGTKTADPPPPFDSSDATKLTYAPGARRLEYSVASQTARAALGASLEYILNIGVDRILAHCQALNARLATGLQKLGGTIITPLERNRRAGILSVRFPGRSAVELTRELQKLDVIVSPRNGLLRFASHLFNDETDIDRALGALEHILRS